LAINEADPTPTTITLTASRDYYRLSSRRAAKIEAEIRGVVANWQAEAAKLGLARQEIAAMEPVIVPGR
jgi:hypothetical protein